MAAIWLRSRAMLIEDQLRERLRKHAYPVNAQ
jgi:hypothetical protein